MKREIIRRKKVEQVGLLGGFDDSLTLNRLTCLESLGNSPPHWGFEIVQIQQQNAVSLILCRQIMPEFWSLAWSFCEQSPNRRWSRENGWQKGIGRTSPSAHRRLLRLGNRAVEVRSSLRSSLSQISEEGSIRWGWTVGDQRRWRAVLNISQFIKLSTRSPFFFRAPRAAMVRETKTDDWFILTLEDISHTTKKNTILSYYLISQV